jgi:ribosome-binding protein aMBF1 (putative translation factor)
MKSYKSLKTSLLNDRDVRKYYDELSPEFAVIELMIEKRLRRGLSQGELAKKIGTKQSAISRFESGAYNPTLNFLHKVADALDAKVRITVS